MIRKIAMGVGALMLFAAIVLGQGYPRLEGLKFQGPFTNIWITNAQAISNSLGLTRYFDRTAVSNSIDGDIGVFGGVYFNTLHSVTGFVQKLVITDEIDGAAIGPGIDAANIVGVIPEGSIPNEIPRTNIANFGQLGANSLTLDGETITSFSQITSDQSVDSYARQTDNDDPIVLWTIPAVVNTVQRSVVDVIAAGPTNWGIWSGSGAIRDAAGARTYMTNHTEKQATGSIDAYWFPDGANLRLMAIGADNEKVNWSLISRNLSAVNAPTNDPGGSTFWIEESFDGGTIGSWSEDGSDGYIWPATVSPAPLAGTGSVMLWFTNSASSRLVRYGTGAATELWGEFMFRFTEAPGGLTQIVDFRNGLSTVASIRMQSTRRIYLYVGSLSMASPVATVPLNTTVYVFFRIKTGASGTAEFELSRSTTSTRPTSGDTYASGTGTLTGTIDNIRIRSMDADTKFSWFDDLTISTTDWP